MSQAAFILLLVGCSISVGEGDFLKPSKVPWTVVAPSENSQLSTVTVTHPDGNVSHGVALHSPDARATVLFFAGNGETLDREGAARIWQLARINVNAYLFDRRGYGRTAGVPTVALLISDALEIFDHVRAESRGLVVVHGFSLGSTVAAAVANRRAVDALVIEGGSPSVAAFVDVHLPWYARVFGRVQISEELARVATVTQLRFFTGPLLIAVGERDDDTVPALAKRLYAELSDPMKELFVVPDAPHNALTTPQGLAGYTAFLRRIIDARQ